VASSVENHPIGVWANDTTLAVFVNVVRSN
jgi:hypothetical protein